MAKEIARFELTNRSNYLLRWTIDDDANLIFNNSDDSKYIEISGRKYYNSALFNFPSSITGHFLSVGLLLSDKPTRIYAQESSDGGATWANSYQTSPMTLSYGTIYSLPGPTSNWNGIYAYNNNENDSQCISSIAPLFDITSKYNEYVSTLYEPPKKSGGAGSGYIGNSLLSNKKMVGYNVPTSSAESTKTESINEASETPISGKPKIGNGHARIKFLRDWAPPAEYQELLDLINGANFTEKYYMTDNWITKLSDSATSGATASIDNGFKSYSYARYTDTGNSNIWYTNPSQQWNNSSYSNNKYVAGTASWEGTTEPCTCGIVAFSKLNINVNKTINDNYTFTLNNLSPLAVYSFYGTKYYIFRVRYNPSDSPTGWRSFSVSYTELPPEYLGSVSYTGTLENCLKVIAMNFRNVNIYVDGVLWSSAVR